MRYPSTITLFMEPLPATRRPSAFVVSAALHGALMTAVSLGYFHVPIVRVSYPKERFTVRILKLQDLEESKRAAAEGNSAYYPDHRTAAQTPARTPSAGGATAMAQNAPIQAAQHLHAPQTLIQPDLPRDLLLPKKVPIPQMLLWSAKDTHAEKIVLAPVLNPMAANARPVIEKPNNEQRVADIQLASTPLVKESAFKFASTTSPVVLKAPEQAQQAIPQMAADTREAPAPSRVLSISDLRMVNGSVPVPRANESAHNLNAGALSDVSTSDHTQAGSGKSSGVSGTAGSVTKGVGTPEAAQGYGGGAEGAGKVTYDHIRLPHDGVFGVVVVGSSVADQYPETAALWSGRLASTVYVHVGLAKSWILQYSLPKTASAETLNLARVEAPWPYDISRPTLGEGDLDADALMVHGFVNKDGRFETLSVVFPPQFAREKFVLDALNQWQFRPAMQNRQATPVEILLVIPDELN